jgi:hypothetical protein
MVRGDLRVKSRRGAVGKIMGRYGGREHVVVDVQLSDGRRRLLRVLRYLKQRLRSEYVKVVRS